MSRWSGGKSGLSGSDDPELMRVLFVTHNSPPEVNALARRTYERAVQWAEDGGDVEILTGPPHYPEGAVYPGYRYRLTREAVEGGRRPPHSHGAKGNRGARRRILDYVSFTASAAWHGPRSVSRAPDVVVASSPQFVAALAGRRIARALDVPFVLEIRDLWPESPVATGVIGRNRVVRYFEDVERRLYRDSDHIVIVTDSFREHIEDFWGFPPERSRCSRRRVSGALQRKDEIRRRRGAAP